MHTLFNVAPQDISSEERTVLSVVSYIGCGISIACLLVTIVVLLYYRLVVICVMHGAVLHNFMVRIRVFIEVQFLRKFLVSFI